MPIVGHVYIDNLTELIDDEDFSPAMYDLLQSVLKCLPLFTQFPWIIYVVRRIPSWVLLWLDPKAECVNDVEKYIKKLIEEREPKQGIEVRPTVGGRSDLISPQMTRNLVPFSRGSRNCIGMNLATAELNLMLAALFCPSAPRFELAI
ncbi:hypothetical protein CIB48_g7945 [Xylaria polymorpha]|nr:hypothetical protein CIB48_g7945 [Xylaria polymorpha]